MRSAEVATFDTIHDTQTVFRKLLDALARPGKIQSIAHVTGRVLVPVSFSPALLACASALVDGEVTFAVVASAAAETSDYLRWQTFSSPTALDEADYVLVDDELPSTNIEQLLARVKRGTLMEPHTSATLFITVAELTSVSQEERMDLESVHEMVVLELTGPGVNTSTTCAVKGLSRTWLQQRALVNAEYPLGIDMVFATKHGELMALPRTTVVRVKSVPQEV